ncbi:MAG TPA: FAD-dependent oxidoreductase [Steroidobacteraceae bacterium]
MTFYRIGGFGISGAPVAKVRIPEPSFAVSVQVVIVGGGGCGLTAALAARDHGAGVAVFERDKTLAGSTGMSTGLIPGAASKLQRSRGIPDSAEIFARDILEKTNGQTDGKIVETLASESGRTIDWLTERHRVPLTLVDGFLYPGHSQIRMHGTPNRTGTELMGALISAPALSDVDIITEALVADLYADEHGRIRGIHTVRRDGLSEDVGCEALVLACSGFAGNTKMVAEYIPEISHAELFGHTGNEGHAIRWGQALGAMICDLHAYQGHGGLAAGHRIPILWPLIVAGGIQVNCEGQRFANEARGYSEQAVVVTAQPGHFAWDVYDERIHKLMLEFQDYRDAVEAGAIITASTTEELAQLMSMPATGLQTTLTEVAQLASAGKPCPFGRSFESGHLLKSPFYAAKVKGALFHTQGGLAVDQCARVLRKDGSAFPNLFAGGGAARGISGPGGWGYLAGNGLLAATTLGRLAGQAAGLQVRARK